MKKQYALEDGTLIQLMHCRCSVWPLAIRLPVRRCGECGVVPHPIPDWTER